jgi:coenzyme Q-binding protein COQ10
MHRRIGFPREKVFAVVADVSRYAEFVPYCLESRVLSRSGPERFLAELVVGFGALEERYTSRVTLVAPARVEAHAAASPLFHFLSSAWRLEAAGPHACDATFAVAFRWRLDLHRTLTELAFDQVYRGMIDAFERRCTALYGSPAAP